MRCTFLAVISLLLLVASADAGPRRPHVRYIGIHPVPIVEGGGICYVEGPHVHLYAADRTQYREHHGAYVFIGDPGKSYEGPKHAYKGHHPVHVDVIVDSDEPDIEYCYLDGLHHHAYAAPEGPDFVLTGGVYMYVAATPLPPKPVVVVKPVRTRVRVAPTVVIYEHHHHHKHKHKHKHWKHKHHRHHWHDDDDDDD